MLFRAFRDVSYTQQKDRHDFRRLADEAGEHLAIVEGLRAGDRKAAAHAMARHLLGGMKYWTRALPETLASAPQLRNGRKHGHNGKVTNGASR
jgi:DNA-binding GntR family transcriptional regulator